MAAIQPISKIVNKQTKIIKECQTSALRMAKMFDVIEDDMDRYRLLTVN